MNSGELLSKLPGGHAVVDWFGAIPHFHDAVIVETNLVSDGASMIRIHAFRMTDKVDSDGYYETEKHAVVEINFGSIQVVELENFDLKSIIFNLEFKGTEAQTEVCWTSSYGAEGRIVGGGVNLTLVPGKPEASAGS